MRCILKKLFLFSVVLYKMVICKLLYKLFCLYYLIIKTLFLVFDEFLQYIYLLIKLFNLIKPYWPDIKEHFIYFTMLFKNFLFFLLKLCFLYFKYIRFFLRRNFYYYIVDIEIKYTILIILLLFLLFKYYITFLIFTYTHFINKDFFYFVSYSLFHIVVFSWIFSFLYFFEYFFGNEFILFFFLNFFFHKREKKKNYSIIFFAEIDVYIIERLCIFWYFFKNKHISNKYKCIICQSKNHYCLNEYINFRNLLYMCFDLRYYCFYHFLYWHDYNYIMYMLYSNDLYDAPRFVPVIDPRYVPEDTPPYDPDDDLATCHFYYIHFYKLKYLSNYYYENILFLTNDFFFFYIFNFFDNFFEQDPYTFVITEESCLRNLLFFESYLPFFEDIFYTTDEDIYDYTLYFMLTGYWLDDYHDDWELFEDEYNQPNWCYPENLYKNVVYVDYCDYYYYYDFYIELEYYPILFKELQIFIAEH